MHMTRFLATTALGLAALSVSPVAAQDYAGTVADPGDIPADYATLPSEYAQSASTVSADEVETITRTRWIERNVEETSRHQEHYEVGYMDHAHHPHGAYPATNFYPVRFDRESWLEECHARTRDLDDGDDRKGGIIGALLGAIGGGIIGNRAWDSERLLGSVVGAGVGGLAGYAIGSAIGGGDDHDYRYRYDCEAALDRYMSGASYPVPHVAARSMPAHGYGYAPAAYGYGYAPMYGAGYGAGCACAQPMTMIEVREEIPQHVIVRENVREEWVDEPAVIRERVIEEAPAPRPVPTKTRPIKSSPKMIKGS